MEAISLPRLELARLHEQLGRLFADQDPQGEALGTFLQFTLSLVNGSAALIHRNTNGVLKIEAQLFSKQAESWSDNLQAEIEGNARRAFEGDKAALTPLQRTVAATILTVPFHGGAAFPSGCLSVVLLPGTHALEIFVAILQLLAVNLGMWLQRESGADTPALSEPSMAVTLLVAEVIEEKRELAASLLVNRLRELLQAETLILASCAEGKKPLVTAISSLVDFSRQSPAARQIQQVLDECSLHRQILVWPATALANTIASPILKGLSTEYAAEQAVCLPVFDRQGKGSGIVVVLWHTLSPDLHSGHLRILAESGGILGSFSRWLRPAEKSASSRFAGLPRWKKLLVGLGLLLVVVALCCLPVRHFVSADCVLMPRTTRHVVAQFDGILQKVVKEAGMKVQQGEKIAQLDGQSIELEISSLQAEISKNRKLQDVSMVAGQTASAQIARLERERLTEKLKLLELQSTMLTIQSPIDGVIIGGAVEKAEGGPVRKGQTLFEIAPLDRMIVELHVRQEDFQYIARESRVKISLDAYPGTVFSGVINTIHPKAELKEGSYVFLAQCFLDNQQGSLQPGMNGSASVAAELRPLLWVALKKPWTALQKIFR
jgi:biotin carboxyl carrier protein